MEDGTFADEIIPVEIQGKVISVDDTIRKGNTLESLSKLKPAFEWGDRRTTAGNASGVGDGAAICILTQRRFAEAEGMEILGKFVGSAFVGKCIGEIMMCRSLMDLCIGVEPRYMGISPVAAIPKVLAQAGLNKEDIDVFEV